MKKCGGSKSVIPKQSIFKRMQIKNAPSDSQQKGQIIGKNCRRYAG